MCEWAGDRRGAGGAQTRRDLHTAPSSTHRAMREFEYVLEHEPGNVEAVTILAEIEEKLATGKGEMATTARSISIIESAVGGNLMADIADHEDTLREARRRLTRSTRPWLSRTATKH